MNRRDEKSWLPSYVLITPARNEAKFIEQTILCMTAQTTKPLRWVIVSDGSTDGTDEIAGRYTKEYSWIHLLRMPERAERHFGGKVMAFNAGYAIVKHMHPDVIGNLDADVTFGPDHFEKLLFRCTSNNRLGVWGAPYIENNSSYDYRFSNIENVWGGCQLFRRECYEDIGGYRPLKGGLIDHVAVVSARMKGWKTQTFLESVCQHNRAMGTAQNTILQARFYQGVKDYAAANHPLWEAFRVIYQMGKEPYILGGLVMAAGFFKSSISRRERSVTPDLMAFTRREQMMRLKRLLGFRYGHNSANARK